MTAAGSPVPPATSRVLCLLRLVFSFPLALACALAALAVLTVSVRFNDPDLWWQLRIGQIIWTQREIPRIDLLSFTTSQYPWVPHEWLSQLSMYALWRLGDYPGLMFGFALLTTALLAIQFVNCSLYSGHASVAFLGALVTWFFSTVGLAIRPQLWGYVLLACELLILHLGRSQDRRWFRLLPFLFVVWVNSHGSFFFGMIVLAVVLSMGCVSFNSGLLIARPFDRAQRKTLGWATLLSVAALFLQPAGWELLTYPLRTLFDRRLQLDAVAEWQRLSFDDIRAFGLLAVAGSILLIVLIRRTRLYLDELALLGIAFVMAILHQRLLFAWGIVAAPVLCRQIADWLNNGLNDTAAGRSDPSRPARNRTLLNATLVLASIGVAIAAFPAQRDLLEQVARGNPVQAVNFIRDTHLAGRMLNEYTYGGYLAWALPDQKVFIDGRADVYAWTGVFEEYGAWATLRHDPQLLLDKYRIDFCLLSQSSPLARVLRYLPAWSERYTDSRSVIFVRSGGAS